MKCPHCDKEIEIKFADPCHEPYLDNQPIPVAADGLPGIAVKFDPYGNIVECHDAVFDPKEGKWYGPDADRKNSEMGS